MARPKSRAQVRRQRANKGKPPFRRDKKRWWLDEQTPARLAFRLAAMEIEGSQAIPHKKRKTPLVEVKNLKTSKIK